MNISFRHAKLLQLAAYRSGLFWQCLLNWWCTGSISKALWSGDSGPCGPLPLHFISLSNHGHDRISVYDCCNSTWKVWKKKLIVLMFSYYHLEIISQTDMLLSTILSITVSQWTMEMHYAREWLNTYFLYVCSQFYSTWQNSLRLPTTMVSEISDSPLFCSEYKNQYQRIFISKASCFCFHFYQ